MKRFYLIKHPILFQGEQKNIKNKNYFEGWYFKNTNKKETISFIPGINITKQDKKAFIQIITNDSSYFVEYDENDFYFNHDPFFIRIGNNYFDYNTIEININDKKQHLYIEGRLTYTNHNKIQTNLFHPNIMGPFSYLPFMECNHALLSMKHHIHGTMKINHKVLIFDQGIGYMEKDWGISFPKKYIWLQGNHFNNEKASFMLSIADIPFQVFHFRGLICMLKIDEIEYLFTTYNLAKIKTCHVERNYINIILKRNNYILEIKAFCNTGNILFAPIKGQMIKNIVESISSTIEITLKHKHKILFFDTSINCGLEVVNEESSL